MNRHILSIVAIVAILSCLSPLPAHTDGEKAVAASSESMVCSRFSPPSISLDLPRVFTDGEPNYKLFDYPDMEEFYFHVPIAPWGQPRLNAHVTSCQQELVADFLYQPTAHRIREHYGCDLRPFWKESSQFQMEMEDKETRRRLMSAYVQGVEGTQAAQGIESVQSVQSMETFQAIQSGKQTQSISHLRAARGEGSRMSDYQRSVRVCQLSEAAEGCVFGDRLVSCIRAKVVQEVGEDLFGRFGKNKASTIEELIRYGNKQSGKLVKNAAKLERAMDLTIATQQWTRSMCDYLTEQGQCAERMETVGGLPMSMRNACF
eukprot:GHVS01027273.1.p1 GENE.GHVS01027273.1~~GHVS01027273.1.p1  ORF type:complete len:327 (+),score=34.73 GHVS01027273.1:28-981(+)